MEWKFIDYRLALVTVVQIFNKYNVEITTLNHYANHIVIMSLSPFMLIELRNGCIVFTDVPCDMVDEIITLTDCICYEFNTIGHVIDTHVGYKFIKGYDIIAFKKQDVFECTVYCNNRIVMYFTYDGIINISHYNMGDKTCVKHCIQNIYDVTVSMNYYRRFHHDDVSEIDYLFNGEGEFYQRSDVFQPQFLD